MSEDAAQPALGPLPQSKGVPDPNGPPVRVLAQPLVEAARITAMVVAAGGAALFAMGALVQPCVGALRSVRLLREQRHQEILAAKAHLEVSRVQQSTTQSDTSQ